MQVTNHNRVWVPVTLFLLTFLIYAVSLPNQFLWDDEEAIVQNQLIHSLSNLPKFWTGGIFNSYGTGLTGGFYRPLTTTIMATLWAISHDPWIFRLFQVSLHAIVTVLLFFLLARFFPPWLAFAGSAIFAIHPGISEAVLWISTIADPLATLLLLVSFFLLFQPSRVWLSSFLFFLALLTKETSLAFLPIILLYLVFYDKKTIRQAMVWFLGASLLYGLIRVFAVGPAITQALHFPSPIAQANVPARLLTVPGEITYYLKTFFWPMPLSISRHFVVSEINSPAFLLPVGLLVIFLAVVIRMRKNKLFLFFITWFLVTLLPALNLIVPLSATVADRWLYLPGIGLIGLILMFLKRLPKRATIMICGTVVLVFSLLTIQRSLQWRSGLILFSHDVLVNPRSFDLQNNYGVEMFRTGAVDQAKGAFERSITLNPRWWVAYNNAGAIAERLGDTQKAETLYRTSIDRGSYYLAYENLAKLLLFRQKAHQEARDLSAKALKAFPASANLWMVAAIASYQLGNRDEALAAARQLYALSPNQQTATLLSRITSRQPIDLY